MLAETALEMLRFLKRHQLEALQMKSRFLRCLIDRNSSDLPLRYIYGVSIGSKGDASIQLVENEYDERSYLSVMVSEENVEELFNRVSNAYIRRLELSFDPGALRFPNYLRDNAGHLQCRIKMFNAGLVEDEPAEIDYGLVDFVDQALRPQIYENVMLAVAENYALLGEQATMRTTILHLMFFMLCGAPAPDCIIPALFNVDALETCGIVTEIDPRQWIATLVKTFETAEPATTLVKSVALIHEHCDELAPASNTFARLGLAVPTFLRQAARYSFENTNLGKRLEAHTWMIKETAENVTYKHCALLLTIVDAKYLHTA